MSSAAEEWSARIEASENQLRTRRSSEKDNALRIARFSHLGNVALPCAAAALFTGSALALRGKSPRVATKNALKIGAATVVAQGVWHLTISFWEPSSTTTTTGSSSVLPISSPLLPSYAALSASAFAVIAALPSPPAMMVGVVSASALVGAGGAAMLQAVRRLSRLEDGPSSNR